MAWLEMVFFDIGGVMYDDTIYARAMHTALRAMGASFTDREFDDWALEAWPRLSDAVLAEAA